MHSCTILFYVGYTHLEVAHIIKHAIKLPIHAVHLFAHMLLQISSAMGASLGESNAFGFMSP